MSTANLALVVAGMAIVALALVDLFVTVFNYDGFTFLSGRYQRALWRIGVTASAVLPPKPRAAARSLGSALLLPATVAWWLAAEITGFALVFASGMHTGGFHLASGARPGLGLAYYLSAGAETTLTFGDAIPAKDLYRALVDLQTVAGLATFTLALGYLVTTYGVLDDLDSLHNTVRRHARDPSNPTSILARHYRGGVATELTDLLQVLSERLESYDDGLRRYPVVFYFHTRRPARSIPQVFATLGELLAAIRWGLPADDPMAADPWLAALLEQYSATIARLQRSFVGPERLQPPTRATVEEFRRAYQEQPALGGEDQVGRFRQLQDRTRRATELPLPPDGDLDQTFGRYQQWLEFDSRQRQILDQVRSSLGYPEITAA